MKTFPTFVSLLLITRFASAEVELAMPVHPPYIEFLTASPPIASEENAAALDDAKIQIESVRAGLAITHVPYKPYYAVIVELIVSGHSGRFIPAGLSPLDPKYSPYYVHCVDIIITDEDGNPIKPLKGNREPIDSTKTMRLRLVHPVEQGTKKVRLQYCGHWLSSEVYSLNTDPN